MERLWPNRKLSVSFHSNLFSGPWHFVSKWVVFGFYAYRKGNYHVKLCKIILTIKMIFDWLVLRWMQQSRSRPRLWGLHDRSQTTRRHPWTRPQWSQTARRVCKVRKCVFVYVLRPWAEVGGVSLRRQSNCISRKKMHSLPNLSSFLLCPVLCPRSLDQLEAISSKVYRGVLLREIVSGWITVLWNHE